MPHTPPASPTVGKKTEEEKSFNSTQDSSFDESSSESSFDESSYESSFDESSYESSFDESDEEQYELSEEDNEQTSEESSQQTTGPNQETQASQNNTPRRNANTLFGFTPRPQSFVCPHGHIHIIDFVDENTAVFITLNASPEIMRLMALVTILEALALDDENDLEENVDQQTEHKQEEEPIKVSEGTSQEEVKESEEENNEEFGYSYFSM